jgi:Domain of unknown function (DUF5011)
MAFSRSGNAGIRPVLIFAALLLVSLASATDPTTSATATANGGTYNFGDWTQYPVYVTLSCGAGSSDCAATSYCIDSSNSCDPTVSGTAYGGQINVSGEGISYVRYASNNSTGGWGDVASGTIQIDSTPPTISISDDASGSWTNSDTIAVSTGDGSGSGVTETKWVARADSSCSGSQDSELDSGTDGTSMQANNDTLYQDKYICFRSTDAAGNRNYAVSSEITKLDTTPPAIDAGQDRTASSQFTEDASVTDSGSGIASYSWTAASGPGTVDFGSSGEPSTTISADTDGTYAIGLTATDNAGNSAYASFNLVWDTTAASISVSSPDNSASQSKSFSATASKGTLYMSITTGSACDASLAFTAYSPTTFSSESDNGKKICYKAVDEAGITSYSMSGAVSGIDTTKPVITLQGSPAVTMEVHGSYSDAGATASDNYDGVITSRIATNNTVNRDVVGTYTVTYDVADAAGNKAQQATRTVNVVDTTKPVITLKGNSTVTIAVNGNYTDAGATASDNYDGDLTSKIVVSNPVNTGAAGTYTVTYDVSDAAGNKAAQVTRTVQVKDNTWELIAGAAIVAVAVAVIVLALAGAYMLFMRRKKGL